MAIPTAIPLICCNSHQNLIFVLVFFQCNFICNKYEWNKFLTKISTTYASSFYRLQNILDCFKCFVIDQFFFQIVPVPIFLCLTKRWFAFSKFSFWAGKKCFGAIQILVLLKKFLTGKKHFGTCRRTRH